MINVLSSDDHLAALEDSDFKEDAVRSRCQVLIFLGTSHVIGEH